MGLTPMMQQYFKVKENFADCILFFRLGDFYEMFFEDAEVASRELELVLTGRDCGLEQRAPMCGIPFHAANSYISRLVSKGYKIAICEQLEDPSVSKGIVKRDVTKIITPGTYIDQLSLEENKNNYIMSIYFDTEKNDAALCFSDLSTGELSCTSLQNHQVLIFDEISKHSPRELIIHESIDEDFIISLKQRFNITITRKPSTYFTSVDLAALNNQFINFHAIEDKSNVVYAVNAILCYAYDTQKVNLTNLNTIDYYNVVDYLAIDSNSRRNLELTESIRERTKKGSLLWVLDKTCTAMGGRQLRRWIDQPLVNRKAIEQRLGAIEELISSFNLLSDLRESLRNVYDIERIAGKIASKSVNAKELISLKNSLLNIPKVKEIISYCTSKELTNLYKRLDTMEDICILIDKAIHDNPSLSVKEGGIIKDGFDPIVDELRNSKAHGKEWIASLEAEEKAVTGIKSLKVSYNKVFGYYIEITNANLGSIPKDRYIRRQTLSNAERFITPELKAMEEKILGAEEKLISIEYELFIQTRDRIEQEINRIKNCALILSDLDCLFSLALVSLENNYCKPSINEKNVLEITEGRHPVIEKLLPSGSFISNSTLINTDEQQLILVTGPNMAGKSTYMRQVALIVLMAQIGCYVPADKADICICDKIFTRIGASDDLASGKSTFMVEMWEVSNILSNASNKSLILLDEVGRGTSTYDGLSIAWSVIEYICSNTNLKCKTLFATHYHELTKLEGVVPGVKNYSVAVKEVGNEVVFLRKIVPGGSDQSYGIEVAKLAGLPVEVIKRAKNILESLENESKLQLSTQNTQFMKESALSIESSETHLLEIPHKDEERNKAAQKSSNKSETQHEFKQIDFADLEKESFIKEIASIDILNMTPLESFNKMYEMIKRAKSF